MSAPTVEDQAALDVDLDLVVPCAVRSRHGDGGTPATQRVTSRAACCGHCVSWLLCGPCTRDFLTWWRAGVRSLRHGRVVCGHCGRNRGPAVDDVTTTSLGAAR